MEAVYRFNARRIKLKNGKMGFSVAAWNRLPNKPTAFEKPVKTLPFLFSLPRNFTFICFMLTLNGAAGLAVSGV